MDLKTKSQIRKYILEIRDGLNINQRMDWDLKIFDLLINSEFYRNAHVIFTFVSFKTEVNTHKFIEYALNDKKVICVPKIKLKDTGIEVFKISSLNDLETGYFKILEPKEQCPSVDSDEIDLILMPGVAFDRYGGRIGYGKGFYDRYLQKMKRKVKKIALAYQFQVLDRIPVDENDVRIDAIVTNEGILDIKNSLDLT